MKIVKKPWGEELWIAHTDKYAGKIIRINKGCRSSLQYHRRKHETIYVQKGILRVTEEDETGKLQVRSVREGEIIINPPYKKHRIEALEDTTFIEISTSELDDVVRVEDDWGRIGA